MSIEIAVSDDLASCHLLRRIVFIEEQGVSEAEEMDDLDSDGIHILATENAIPIGTARLHIKGEIAKIGRVCILKSHRGTGLGAALIHAAIDVARQHSSVNTVKLGAQVHALGFYEKLGFVAQGPIFDDAGIDHREMVLSL